MPAQPPQTALPVVTCGDFYILSLVNDAHGAPLVVTANRSTLQVTIETYPPTGPNAADFIQNFYQDLAVYESAGNGCYFGYINWVTIGTVRQAISFTGAGLPVTLETYVPGYPRAEMIWGAQIVSYPPTRLILPVFNYPTDQDVLAIGGPQLPHQPPVPGSPIITAVNPSHNLGRWSYVTSVP